MFCAPDEDEGAFVVYRNVILGLLGKVALDICESIEIRGLE
jgi:hypothetical protein